ncbi:diguanylate cyclase (GGDEF)-like protein [Novosphingobium sp. PhB165]|uniref:diguanylate cyclase n=1 Tax=Novosphingobium sp. PhB165 TaxID=2485105 RepID=UPI0010E77B6D|nr:diguanylate cyclase [Novosphingobium sp. PhB165]TCM15000.1 diguanylate cyclase (GGDEF)-like protein [Novosphingobium sp. PhB165]
MAGSLSRRIVVLCVILSIVLAGLAGLLLDASAQMRASLTWITHSSQVLETADRALRHLQAAESGQRGFTLTQNPEFAVSFPTELAEARREAAGLVALTSDNPLQNTRAKQVQNLIDERAKSLEETARLTRRGDFEAARAYVAAGHGRFLMLLVTARTNDLLEAERALAANRMDAVKERLDYIRWLVLFGTPITVITITFLASALIRRIRRPVDAMMAVMGQLGAGDRSARITARMESSEFQRLARGYNRMADELESAVADQVVSAQQLHHANHELSLNAEVLRERGEVIELLGGMAHRMQAARTDEELASIIRVFVPRVLPEVPGALFAHNNSRNLLIPIAAWGGIEVAAGGFAPDQCWALRRGQSHFVIDPESDIVCAHVGNETDHYHCEPLLAGGEVIGVLYLKGVVEAENRFRMTVLTENIASALVNHRLQRGLREQTIRDPLTGLFNRRYMEETLALEIARASRGGTPLGLVMCDVDHFKRFNDEFGHEAGDAVLQAVAAEMRSRFRDGDVVCRFGGEEFTIIAPGTSAAALAERVEAVRQAIGELNIHQGGRTLGATTMSFGIAVWEENMERDGSTLIKVADAALYRAKREGRNRVVLDSRAESMAA